MNASFTIVAKNYIGLAGVLEASVKAGTDCDFFIVVADEFTAAEKENVALAPNVLIAKDTLGIAVKQWDALSFQYNLVEFCTAIKATCFKFLFQKKGYEKVIYLDPDIMAFSSLAPIYQQLEESAIILTPHLLQVQTVFTGDFPDHLFLVNGIFNLGFLGLKNNSDTSAMLDWWQDRLFKECYFDNDMGLATDQKWMNFLPAFFEPGKLHISRNPGCNAAPWNFFERKIIQKDNQFYVTNRLDENDTKSWPLIFVHFSGYDYKKLSRREIDHKNEAIDQFDDWQPVFEQYARALLNGSLDQYMHFSYSYNHFENGYSISRLHRRIFRRAQEFGHSYEGLFTVGPSSFYQVLKSKGLIDKTPVSADGITNKNMPGFSKKIRYVNWCFKVLLRVLGVRRYSIFIRFFKRYFKEENQFFLVDNKNSDKLQ